MTGKRDWGGRTGTSWAAEWRRTDRSFGGLTERLLQRTRQFAFEAALDVGCGAGELSLALARGRSGSRVIGVDISPQLIEVARERGENLPNASFELGNAAEWTPPAGFGPELLVSRHGVMFFDDPVGAFTHLAAISTPGAGLLFSCFRRASENETFTAFADLLPRPATPPDLNAPGPLAFADPDRVRDILADAGWTGIEFEPFDFAMVAGVGANAVEDAFGYFQVIGPAAAAMAEMGPAQREQVLEQLHAYLQAKQVDNIVALGAAAWIVTARRI
jgi:SAM-dependent methyltransferase